MKRNECDAYPKQTPAKANSNPVYRKPLKLQLSDGDEVVTQMKLDPALQVRLMVYSRCNKLSLIKMIERALIYATSLDGNHPDISVPSEDGSYDYVAELFLE